MRVAFIGGGVMAEALLSQAIVSNICTAKDIQVSELLSSRAAYLENQYGVSAGPDNIDLDLYKGIIVK